MGYTHTEQQDKLGPVGAPLGPLDVLMCKHEDPPWIFVATMGQLGYNTEIDVVLRCMNKLHEDVCARSRFYITREKYGTEFKQWYAKNCNNGQMTKLDFDQLKRYDVAALRKHWGTGGATVPELRLQHPCFLGLYCASMPERFVDFVWTRTTSSPHLIVSFSQPRKYI